MGQGMTAGDSFDRRKSSAPRLGRMYVSRAQRGRSQPRRVIREKGSKTYFNIPTCRTLRNTISNLKTGDFAAVASAVIPARERRAPIDTSDPDDLRRLDALAGTASLWMELRLVKAASIPVLTPKRLGTCSEGHLAGGRGNVSAKGTDRPARTPGRLGLRMPSGFAECLQWRWLPGVLASSQPSDSILRIQLRTFASITLRPVQTESLAVMRFRGNGGAGATGAGGTLGCWAWLPLLDVDRDGV